MHTPSRTLTASFLNTPFSVGGMHIWEVHQWLDTEPASWQKEPITCTFKWNHPATWPRFVVPYAQILGCPLTFPAAWLGSPLQSEAWLPIGKPIWTPSDYAIAFFSRTWSLSVLQSFLNISSNSSYTSLFSNTLCSFLLALRQRYLS